MITHFIEQTNDKGVIKSSSPISINQLNWSLNVSKKFNIETIAVFKIELKPKVVVAHYDYDLKTCIVE